MDIYNCFSINSEIVEIKNDDFKLNYIFLPITILARKWPNCRHDLRTNKTFESIFFIPCGDISSKGQNPFNLVLDLFVNMSAK